MLLLLTKRQELCDILCLSFLWRAACKVRQDDGVWWRAACKVRQDDDVGGEQRARLVRMTVLLRYFVYPSYGEQRERFVRMTMLLESNVQGSSSLLQLKLDTPRQAG